MSRRDKLLDAAFETLAHDHTIRPEAVARRAGASKALLFHHFLNLTGLHDSMTERVLRETQEGLDALAHEYPDPRARLLALTRALLTEPPDDPTRTRRVLRFWLAEEPRANLRDSLLTDFITKTLGETRTRADPRRIASLVLTRWHGATTVYASGGYVDFDLEAERTATEIERML